MNLARIFLIVFLGQAALITVILLILKKALDNQLTETAVHRIETLNPNKVNRDFDEVMITAYDDINQPNQKRITDAFYKNCGKNVKLAVKKDKTIKGGIIIQFGDQKIDHSLLSRLRETGLVK